MEGIITLSHSNDDARMALTAAKMVKILALQAVFAI